VSVACYYCQLDASMASAIVERCPEELVSSTRPVLTHLPNIKQGSGQPRRTSSNRTEFGVDVYNSRSSMARFEWPNPWVSKRHLRNIHFLPGTGLGLIFSISSERGLPQIRLYSILYINVIYVVPMCFRRQQNASSLWNSDLSLFLLYLKVLLTCFA